MVQVKMVMMNLTKASNVLCALLVLHGVCVCMGWVGAIAMRQQRTPSQMVRFISPKPQPRNHLSLALHFTWFNVAMCLCTRKIIAHKNECGCQFVHVHVCVDVCMGVCVCMCLDICVPDKVCVFGCLCVCHHRYMYASMYVCMHAQVLGEKTW